jgi:hypothetical protein
MEPGWYQQDETLQLGTEDSHTTWCPYWPMHAKYNERIVISGGIHVPESAVARVHDEAILGRISDKKARENLFQIDLENSSITLSRSQKTLRSPAQGSARQYF